MSKRDPQIRKLPVCLILGAGPGIGYSLARKWEENGYQAVIFRRTAVSVEEIKESVGPNTVAMQCDVTNQEQTKLMVEKVEKDFGAIETMLYNAGVGVWKKYNEVSLAEFDRCMDTNTKGLLISTQIICPKMVKRGRGVVGITGATASLRGKPFTAAFAAAKAAQRSLAQSIAKDLGPHNIHVFYAIIDGVARPDAVEGGKTMCPKDIAQNYWDISHQRKSAWSFEVDMRPFCEKW